MFRIGFGYDVHRLVEGRSLIIGGCKIPHQVGLLGHSDADVLIHDIIDAILGALAKGDIGKHFPDTDPAYKDISSMKLLAKTFQMLKASEFSILNLDTVIFAEAPKLSSHRSAMQQNIAATLKIEPAQINIKATTTEGLGMIGSGEGIGAMAVALIQ